MTSESIPDSPQTGNDSEASAVVSNVRSVKIQIPVAVFTAHRGYDWSKLPDFVSRDEADSLFEKVMSVKTTYCDHLLPYGDSFEGVLYEGKYAFAFRLMTAEKWDQAKRDSNYCACAFIPHDMLKDVDFGRLLDMDYFMTTVPNPAAILDYVDEDYIPPHDDECYSAVKRLVDGSRDVEWRLIGSILSMFGSANIQWLFARIILKGTIRDVSVFNNWDSECLECYRNEMSPNKEPSAGSIFTAGEMSQYGEETIEDDTKLAESDVIYEEMERSRNELLSQVARLERNLQSVTQQRDYARESLARIRQGSTQGEQINLLHVMIAFLIGVIFSVVIFLMVQLLASPSGNLRNSGAYTAVQRVESLQ